MSVQVMPDRPLRSAVPTTYEVMEARLATAKAQALLDRVAADLQRLVTDVVLVPEVAAAVADTLEAVARARRSARAARAALHA